LAKRTRQQGNAMSSRKTNGGVYSTVRGNTALTTGAWYYVTYSTNGSAWKIRVNGAAAQTLTAVLGTNTGDWIGDITASTPDKSDIGGIYAGGSYSSVNFWHGVLDDVRLSNVERSDDWVSTEYNNQSSPSTFYTISTATSLVGASKVQWLVADHLGTPRMIIDQTGALANLKRHDYLPFGEELFAPAGGRTTAMGYASGDAVRQQFTQKERDVETGLDYFLARYYSSSQGRFTSIDPQNIVFDKNRGRNADERVRILQGYIVQPQNWNRYAYTRNNPLAYTDPNGRCSAPAGLSKGNVGICIEAFIASATINGVGRGDNRDFAPNDPSKTNRIQVQGLISRSTFAWDTSLKGRAGDSHLLIGPGFQGKITVDPNQKVDKEGNLHLQLKITGENGLAEVPGAPGGKIQININLIVTPDGRVGIEGGDRTAYPSIGIYVYTTGADGKPAVATLGEGRETTPEALNQPLVPIQPVPPTCNCPKPEDERR
jgi:RHS repeat-associated protein